MNKLLELTIVPNRKLTPSLNIGALTPIEIVPNKPLILIPP